MGGVLRTRDRDLESGIGSAVAFSAVGSSSISSTIGTELTMGSAGIRGSGKNSSSWGSMATGITLFFRKHCRE